MNKFSINWKVKSFIYKIIFFFKVQNLLFFIQKKITKTATFEILEPAIIENSWKYHLRNLQSYNSHEVLEFGGGKSLEQNIFLNYHY